MLSRDEGGSARVASSKYSAITELHNVVARCLETGVIGVPGLCFSLPQRLMTVTIQWGVWLRGLADEGTKGRSHSIRPMLVKFKSQ